MIGHRGIVGSDQIHVSQHKYGFLSPYLLNYSADILCCIELPGPPGTPFPAKYECACASLLRAAFVSSLLRGSTGVAPSFDGSASEEDVDEGDDECCERERRKDGRNAFDEVFDFFGMGEGTWPPNP